MGIQRGGGQGVRTPYVKSQIKWVSIGNKQLDTPWKKLDPLEKNWTPSGALKNDRFLGAQWLSGRVLDSRPKGRGFEPHRRHCVVVVEQDTFILA